MRARVGSPGARFLCGSLRASAETVSGRPQSGDLRSSDTPQAGDGARRARDEPPRLRDARADAIELPDAGIAAKLKRDLGGAVKSGGLEDVAAPERSAGHIYGQPAVHAIVAANDPLPRFSFLREAERLDMLELLVRETVVDLRNLDLRRRSPDFGQTVRHLGGDPGVGRVGPIPRLKAPSIARPSDATDPDRILVQIPRGALRPQDEDPPPVRRIRD